MSNRPARAKSRSSRSNRQLLKAVVALTGVLLVAPAPRLGAQNSPTLPPAVAISREPLQLDPATWVGCHRTTEGPGGQSGVLCAPSIQTGTPEIQARLRAQQAAAQAAGVTNPAPTPPQPMVCGNPGPLNANGQPARRPQGGAGPIRVLAITRGHEFEREHFFGFLDCLGEDITYAHVDYPAAGLLMNPEDASNFDVYLFYDLGGPGVTHTTASGERFRFYPDPPAQLKRDFEALTKAGKGMVFMHHAAAAWAHTWPEYSEVVGGACDWYAPVTVRGLLDPHHGYYPRTEQRLTVADRSHPLAEGLGDGFDLTDEAYACAWFPDSVTPVLTTSFSPPDPRVNLNPGREYSNLTAWYKSSENSPVFYTQAGHDNNAWRVPAYQQLIRNAIRWAASPEALAWARANPTRIFN